MCRPHAVHTHAIGHMPELSVTLTLGTNCKEVHSRSICKGHLYRRKQIARSLLPCCKADKRVEVQARDPFEAFLLDRQQILIKVCEIKSPSLMHQASLQASAKAAMPQETQQLIGHDKARFRQHKWQRDPKKPGAGYGITAVLEGGDLLEKVTIWNTGKSQQLSVFRQQM